MSTYIKILDTTLRDGDQAPGFNLFPEEKVRLANQLAKLKVDIIEVGFPYASEGDFRAVKEIADTITTCSISALCRAREQDIDRTLEALTGAQDPIVNMFIPISDLHIEYVLKKTRKDIVEDAVNAVGYAKSSCANIEVTGVDASRSDKTFMLEFYTAVIEAGAKVIGVTDTVGYMTPAEYGNVIKVIKSSIPDKENVTIAAHCHNDLGLAVANSLAAVENGATQVEGTINGIGERAGNASLEEIIMTLKTRTDYYGVETGVETSQIYPTSKLLSEITGNNVQRNKAIVGRNAFSHDAGIHLDGFKKNPLTYEIMTPESVGAVRPDIELGKYSGRKALKNRLHDIGYDVDGGKLDEAYKEFIILTETKKVIENNDLELIANKIGL